MITKIFQTNGAHKKRGIIKTFYGNLIFASENMIKLYTTSRKDDLESLIYIMCYLFCGNLPIIEYINKNIENF